MQPFWVKFMARVLLAAGFYCMSDLGSCSYRVDFPSLHSGSISTVTSVPSDAPADQADTDSDCWCCSGQVIPTTAVVLTQSVLIEAVPPSAFLRYDSFDSPPALHPPRA